MFLIHLATSDLDAARSGVNGFNAQELRRIVMCDPYNRARRTGRERNVSDCYAQR